MEAKGRASDCQRWVSPLMASTRDLPSTDPETGGIQILNQENQTETPDLGCRNSWMRSRKGL